MAESQDALHFLDYWRVIRSRKEIVIAVFLLVVVTGVLITFSMPKVYMSSVVIKVKSEEASDFDVFGRTQARFDPLFLKTQFEIIQSAPIVEEVVQKRNLDKKLAKAYGFDALPEAKAFQRTVKALRRSMKVQQYRDTNLIQIQVLLSEPKDAVVQEVADTAQAVAEVYRDQNASKSRIARERALTALQESLSEQSNRVAYLAQKVESIRQKYALNLISTSAGPDSELSKMTMEYLEAQRIKGRVELADKESKYKKIQGLSQETLLDVLPRLAGDPGLTVLISQKRAKEVDLAELLKTLGPKHPTALSQESAIKELDVKINEAVNGVKAGVQAEYEAAKATLAIVESELDTIKNSQRKAESSEYREFDTAYQELQHAKKVYETMELRHLQERIEMRIPKTTVEIVEPAKRPDETEPVSPNLFLNIVLSIIVGLGSGIGLAYFVEYLDTSVKTIEDLEKNMGIPVLGVIPQKVKPFVDAAADTAHAEAYRVLRTNIQFSKKLNNGKTFCVTSGSVGEGKSLTLFNLAYICAQLGDRVVLVDTDLHRPRQHKILGVANKMGVANVLMGECSLEQAVIATNVANLSLLASGKITSGVHGLLDTRRMKELVKQLKDSYDIVLFDAPPIIGVSDASLLVREMDGILLVIQHRKYPASVSQRAKTMIENVGGNLIGVVLNNINISRDYSYYYYHHHYYSYPQQGGKSAKK
jgi:capsular exopolysaccharide synthesis family protein